MKRRFLFLFLIIFSVNCFSQDSINIDSISGTLYKAAYYIEGLDYDKDYDLIYELYEQACNLNNRNALADFGYLMLRNALRDKFPEEKALKYINRAMELNSTIAMLYLAHYYFDKRDINKVFLYLNKGDSLGASYATFDLGHLYLYGRLFSNGRMDYIDVNLIDEVAGLKYYEKAAMMNNPAAQYYLGSMYLDGDIVKEDKTKAKELLLKCLNNDTYFQCAHPYEFDIQNKLKELKD